MKVKVSELKTHLSRYLKDLEEKGMIEVCLREEPVAYLVPAGTTPQTTQKALADKVRAAGLRLHAPSREQRESTPPVAGIAGDGRTDVSTVESMRKERDY